MTTSSDRQSRHGSEASAPVGSPRSTKYLGTIISGRYRLEAILSESTTATIFLAEHTHMRKRIAVKVLHAEAASRPAVAERFQREALAGAHIDHPNVALAKDFGTLDDGSRFLVMEYLDGETLRDAVRRGPLGIERALRIARQIALALDAAHSIGVVHAAVVPENVRLVERGGERDIVKLVDFGSALLPESLLNSGVGKATIAQRVPTALEPDVAVAAYTAPEIIEGKTADGRADLYSLGLILWEMVTGERCDVSAGLPPPSLRPHGASATVDALARQMIVAPVDKRIARAIDVVEILQSALAAMRPPRASLVEVEKASFESTILSSARPILRRALDHRAMTKLARRAATALGMANAGRLANASATRFAQTPKEVQVGVAGALTIVAVVVVAIALRSPTAEQTLLSAAYGTSPPSPAPDRPIVASRPTTAVSDAPRFKLPDFGKPGDVDVRALSERFVREVMSGQLKSATTTLESLAQSPSAFDDREVRAAIVRLSQRVTQVRDETPELYFDILTNRMGTAGPDLLYEIVAARSESEAAERALKILRNPAVRERGTAAFRIAYDLRMAKTCQERVALLDRIRDDGDGRTMRALLALSEQCGRRDECCERDDPRVAEAISAVRSRAR